MDGLLVIDKPVGPTSHDVVARIRRTLGERRVGHTGTLDPAATGVLPLVIGRATRLARFLSAGDKSYKAVVQFGVATETFDADGAHETPPSFGCPTPPRDAIDAALDAFRGTFLQQPPRFSAKRIGGQRSYKLARAAARPGQSPQLAFPPRVPVTAHRIEIVDSSGDLVTLRVDCSSGFYVRSLAHDLGERLGIGAHLRSLRRTASAGLTLADALTLEQVERSRDAALAGLVPLVDVLSSLSAVVLTDEGTRHATSGRDIGPADVVGDLPSAQRIRLIDQQGHLVGLAEPGKTPGLLHPFVVLV